MTKPIVDWAQIPCYHLNLDMTTKPERPEWLTDTNIDRIIGGINPTDQEQASLPIISPEIERIMLESLNLHLTPQEIHISARIQGESFKHPIFLMKQMTKEVFLLLKNQYEPVLTPIINWIKSSTDGDPYLEDIYTMATALVLRLCHLQIGPKFWDRLGSLQPGNLLRTLEGFTRDPQRSHSHPMTIIDFVMSGIPEIPSYQIALRSCVDRAYQYFPKPYDDAFVSAAASVHGAIEHFWPQLSKSD